MNENERAILENQLRWLLEDVIPGFERSQQPPSWKAESISRSEMQVANVRWRLEGNPAPICGWKNSYRSHPADCHYCKTGKSRRGFATTKVSVVPKGE